MKNRDRSIKTALTAAGLAAATTAAANNIQVNNVTLQNINTAAGTAIVQFDLSWENSWRVATGPANHDAAWVFIKYHVGDSNWKTASISNNDADHTVPAAATLDVGVNGTRGLGAFIYRSANGSGNNNWASVRLRWNFGSDSVANSALVSLDVHAIEMIYVPEGAFQVGDGIARNVPTNPATISETGTLGSGATGTTPFTVSNAGPITTGIAAGTLGAFGLPAGAYVPIPASFPNGFAPYYAMKYEASQHQWAAFLNTTQLLPAYTYTYFDTTNNIVNTPDVPEAVRARQVFTSPDLLPPRPTPYFVPINVATEVLPTAPTRPLVTAVYPDRAFNTTATNLTAQQANPAASSEVLALAYLDWSGLRPMSEFEYEKLCRGPVPPIAGEYAWGTSDVALQPYGIPLEFNLGLTDDGTPSERPAQNYNELGGNAWTRTTGMKFLTGVPLLGPCRVGMFAKSTYSGPTPPRIQAGAGYYGAMDLTGNVSELVVRWNFPVAAPATLYNGEHGDGVLGTNGQHNSAGWPAGSYGIRGGSFEEAAQPVSTRVAITGTTQRNPGIRGVRSAPAQ